MKEEHMIWLQGNYACGQSLRWVQKYNIHSLQEAWSTCERGDWLLWMANKLGIDERKMVLCAALCAHTVVQYMEDPRNRDAVRIAFLWGRGKATDEQLMAARDASEAAAAEAAAARSASARAAGAALVAETAAAWADAARAADAALVAAAAAAWADAARADDAALVAAALAYEAVWVEADAKKANQLRTARIARKVLTDEVMEKIKEVI